MRLKPLHTTWLTLFTMLILLVSSVVNSAPLMNLQMMQSNTKGSVETVVNTSSHCGSHSMDMTMSQPPMQVTTDAEMDCADSSGTVHNCCTNACSFVFVSLPVPENQPNPQANLAAISLETTQPVVQVRHGVYRPPIV